MELPDGLDEMEFPAWNRTVAGIVAAWEVARALRVERQFERLLASKAGAIAAAELGELGRRASRIRIAFGLCRLFRTYGTPVGARPRRVRIAVQR